MAGTAFTVASVKFQFTHPRGVRSFGQDNYNGADLFQFTHPRGVRFGLLQFALDAVVSIHAPARGAIKY